MELYHKGGSGSSGRHTEAFIKAVMIMDRIGEIWQRTSGVKVIRQVLESLKASGYIEIRQEIPDQELLAIFNEIMPGETIEETVANILRLLK